MIKSKKSLGIKTIVELELDQNTDKAYVSENGIISHNCKYCRNFYIDSDDSPKVYRMSRILNNGSNYGKKADEWKPTALATHPNCRDSQLIELRPGWKVLPGGKQTFIGLDAWQDYIRNKVTD